MNHKKNRKGKTSKKKNLIHAKHRVKRLSAASEITQDSMGAARRNFGDGLI